SGWWARRRLLGSGVAVQPERAQRGGGQLRPPRGGHAQGEVLVPEAAFVRRLREVVRRGEAEALDLDREPAQRGTLRGEARHHAALEGARAVVEPDHTRREAGVGQEACWRDAARADVVRRELQQRRSQSAVLLEDA